MGGGLGAESRSRPSPSLSTLPTVPGFSSAGFAQLEASSSLPFLIQWGPACVVSVRFCVRREAQRTRDSICGVSLPSSPEERGYFCNPRKLIGSHKKMGDEVNLEG